MVDLTKPADALPSATIEDRAALCVPVTLDGKPARVTGYRLQFATVSDAGGRSGEWAWSTVARIVATGGAFSL